MVVITFGLLAAPVVRAWLDQEAGIRQEIVDFFNDERAGLHPDILDVAGPPDLMDAIKAKAARRPEPIMLPVVRMHLRKVRHHLTGEPGVEVKVSDIDLDRLATWLRHRALRQALTQKRPRLVA